MELERAGAGLKGGGQPRRDRSGVGACGRRFQGGRHLVAIRPVVALRWGRMYIHKKQEMGEGKGLCV